MLVLVVHKTVDTLKYVFWNHSSAFSWFFAQARLLDFLFFSSVYMEILLSWRTEMQGALCWGGDHPHFGPLKCNLHCLISSEISSSTGVFSSGAAAHLGSLKTLCLGFVTSQIILGKSSLTQNKPSKAHYSSLAPGQERDQAQNELGALYDIVLKPWLGSSCAVRSTTITCNSTRGTISGAI